MNYEEIESKIRSYLGFAIKANKIVYGVDNILKSKKIKLVISSEDLSPNSTNKLKNKIQSNFIEGYNFKNLVGDSKCKVFGIIEDNLSKVIYQSYQLLLEEKNGKKIIK